MKFRKTVSFQTGCSRCYPIRKWSEGGKNWCHSLNQSFHYWKRTKRSKISHVWSIISSPHFDISPTLHFSWILLHVSISGLCMFSSEVLTKYIIFLLFETIYSMLPVWHQPPIFSYKLLFLVVIWFLEVVTSSLRSAVFSKIRDSREPCCTPLTHIREATSTQPPKTTYISADCFVHIYHHFAACCPF